MKVVFIQDVPGSGKAGEVKNVADGYGRNYLLPRKLAEQATASALKNVDAKIRREAHRGDLAAAEANNVAQQLEGLIIIFKKKVAADTHLYGSIRDVHIAQAIVDQTGLDVGKGSIELAEPIRELGTYEIAVKMAGDIRPKIQVVVEEGDEQ